MLFLLRLLSVIRLPDCSGAALLCSLLLLLSDLSMCQLNWLYQQAQLAYLLLLLLLLLPQSLLPLQQQQLLLLLLQPLLFQVHTTNGLS
jgi:hypothetical protein